ncbi:MAG: chemotaxis protein CheX, partial [Halanaerobiales bacterium]
AVELLDKELQEYECYSDIGNELGKKIVVVVGITGDYKGRVMFESNFSSAKVITETMNYGPLEKENFLYLYMGEFVNILSGRAITFLNNINKERIVRLTPPAIFSGNGLTINTPNIQSTARYFQDGGIYFKLDIGFEGV